MEIKDCSKDVIISGGENLSSVEVESVLYTHPMVNEAAVVARPDEFWGETCCAFVGLKVDDLSSRKQPSEKEIIDFVKLSYRITWCPRHLRGRLRSLSSERLPMPWARQDRVVSSLKL